jgi:hypothetical protein
MQPLAIILLTAAALAAPDRGESSLTVASVPVTLPRLARPRALAPAAEAEESAVTGTPPRDAAVSRDVRALRGKAAVARPEHADPDDRRRPPAPRSPDDAPGRAGGPPPTGR